MKSKIVGVTLTIIIAFIVLVISVFKTSLPSHAYYPMVLSEKVANINPIKIDYELAYQGKIGPDNLLWYVKVLRDRTWLGLTFNQNNKAKLNLLFADKRLNSATELFKETKPDLGFSTLTKSDRYLEKAEALAKDDGTLLKNIAFSSLKHREVIKNEILPISPEDLRPEIIKEENKLKELYTKTREHLISIGVVAPDNPFESN